MKEHQKSQNFYNNIYKSFIFHLWDLVIIGTITYNFLSLIANNQREIAFFKIVILANSAILRQIAKHDIYDPKAKLKLNLWNFKSFILYDLIINILASTNPNLLLITILLLAIIQSFIEYKFLSAKAITNTQQELSEIVSV